MAQPQTASIVLAPANPAAVCASQTPTAALAINGTAASGGNAKLDAARRILVTTTGAESGKTLTLVGLDRSGNPIGEALALPSAGTVASQQDFLFVTGASISAPAAAPLSVGTNGTASTRWMLLDRFIGQFGVSAAINFGAAAGTAAVEVTLDPIQKSMVDAGDNSAAGLPGSGFSPPVPFPVQSGIAADTLLSLPTPVCAVRLTVSAGAAVPGVRFTVLQQGLRP